MIILIVFKNLLCSRKFAHHLYYARVLWCFGGDIDDEKIAVLIVGL